SGTPGQSHFRTGIPGRHSRVGAAAGAGRDAAGSDRRHLVGAAGAMSLVGLEINGTWVRGVLGPLGDYPLPLPLEPPAQDLPMALSLEKSALEVGMPAMRNLRRRP